MTASISQADFWEQRYQQGATGWDLGEVAPPLAKLLGSPLAPPLGKTAVLGCGRGHDALAFAARGYDVVGFDFAPSAIAAAIAHAERAGVGARFCLRDVFTLTAEFPQAFDVAVEHTCFCAIDPARREEYIAQIAGILRPQGWLVGLFWAHGRPGGPPFGCTRAELESLLAPYFEVRQMDLAENSVPGRRGEEYLAIAQRRAA